MHVVHTCFRQSCSSQQNGRSCLFKIRFECACNSFRINSIIKPRPFRITLSSCIPAPVASQQSRLSLPTSNYLQVKGQLNWVKWFWGRIPQRYASRLQSHTGIILQISTSGSLFLLSARAISHSLFHIPSHYNYYRNSYLCRFSFHQFGITAVNCCA